MGRAKFTIPSLSFIPARGWVRWLADGASGAGHVNFSLRGEGELCGFTGSGVARSTRSRFSTRPRASLAAACRTARRADRFPDHPDAGRRQLSAPGTCHQRSVVAHRRAARGRHRVDNTGEAPVDISGWRLGDEFDSPTHYVFPRWNDPPAGRYLVIYEGDFSRGGAGFRLNSAHGDTVHLTAVDATDRPSGLRAVQPIPPMANGVSVGRVCWVPAPVCAVGQAHLRRRFPQVGGGFPRGWRRAQRRPARRPGGHQRNHVRGPSGLPRPWPGAA
ncbi:MAG: hypothetical protein CM1200mP34_2000 [Verrucomicrobiales bacterium]|nr:MAG: hypothetical protein CM1200mP34_2000 [Verrucomicrobiales bacterium]